MNSYNYLAAIFAGVFLSNFVPHFVKGIAGDKFPTPFANPPTRGLSSPFLNVLWALFNLIIGLILLNVSKVSTSNYLSIALLFLGFSATSIMLSIAASKKDQE